MARVAGLTDAALNFNCALADIGTTFSNTQLGTMHASQGWRGVRCPSRKTRQSSPYCSVIPPPDLGRCASPRCSGQFLLNPMANIGLMREGNTIIASDKVPRAMRLAARASPGCVGAVQSRLTAGPGRSSPSSNIRDAEKAIIERKQPDYAFRANFERLKAERRARESE
jgi:hypothetical protein